MAQLPRGLRRWPRRAEHHPEDLDYIIGMILVMQKNIFSDLMPMHQAYVDEGLSALEELQHAGLFGHDIMDAWRDVASGDPDRIAGERGAAPAEQGVIIRDQWDTVRAYKGDVGEAITYASRRRLALGRRRGPAARFRSVDSRSHLPTDAPANDHATAGLELVGIRGPVGLHHHTSSCRSTESMVEENWPRLVATLSVPYEIQLESHRPMMNIPQTLDSAAPV